MQKFNRLKSFNKKIALFIIMCYHYAHATSSRIADASATLRIQDRKRFQTTAGNQTCRRKIIFAPNAWMNKRELLTVNKWQYKSKML